jgi:hypothetical protein
MDYTQNFIRFSGQEWFDTLPKDVQEEWLKEVDLHVFVVEPEKILSDDYTNLNWFIWGSFTMRDTKMGLKYWENVVGKHQTTSLETLLRNHKLSSIGI